MGFNLFFTMRTSYIILTIILFITAGIILAVKDRPDPDAPIPSRNDTVGEIIIE